MYPATPKDIEREKRALAKIAKAKRKLKRKLDKKQECLARYIHEQEELEEKIAQYESSLRHTAKSSFRFGGEHVLVRIAAEIRFAGVKNRRPQKILADNLDRQDQEYGAKDSKFWNTAEDIFYPDKATDFNGFHRIRGESPLSEACILAIREAAKQSTFVPPWPVLDGPMPGVVAAIEKLEFYMNHQEENSTKMATRINTATDDLKNAIADVLVETEPMVVTEDMIFEQDLEILDANAALVFATTYRSALHAA